MEGDSFVYYSKPYETFCVDNLSYMLKQLNMTTFDSGILNLINIHKSQDTDYKHLSMEFNRNAQGKLSLRM